MYLLGKKYTGVLFLIIVSCTFDSGNNEPLIMTRIRNISDTVSIWPRLTFLFSVPLEDTIVDLLILPDPGPVYDTYLADTKDTLYFSVTGTLKGNTPYVITLTRELTAENGNELYPDDAIFDIVTYPGEYEPNNDKVTADTLLTVCFGVISPAHDTDYFHIADSTVKTVYLTSHEKKAGILISDMKGDTIALDDGFEATKTITVSDSALFPLSAGVFTILGNDTRYEIGIGK